MNSDLILIKIANRIDDMVNFCWFIFEKIVTFGIYKPENQYFNKIKLDKK